jgi:hypothetical protein
VPSASGYLPYYGASGSYLVSSPPLAAQVPNVSHYRQLAYCPLFAAARRHGRGFGYPPLVLESYNFTFGTVGLAALRLAAPEQTDYREHW